MIKFEAVNNVIIVIKDKSDDFGDLQTLKPQNMNEVPPPYSGIIDSIGEDNEWSIGDHIAFQDVGGVYMSVGDKEYVVITPEMVIGKLDVL